MTVTVSKFPFAANGRALSLNSTDGFLQLVTRKEDGLLVGAQVAGAGASDIISEIGLAIESWNDSRRYRSNNPRSPNIR